MLVTISYERAIQSTLRAHCTVHAYTRILLLFQLAETRIVSYKFL